MLDGIQQVAIAFEANGTLVDDASQLSWDVILIFLEDDRKTLLMSLYNSLRLKIKRKKVLLHLSQILNLIVVLLTRPVNQSATVFIHLRGLKRR
jgi:hypothetical protein